jgi:hypothetical protein
VVWREGVTGACPRTTVGGVRARDDEFGAGRVVSGEIGWENVI